VPVSVARVQDSNPLKTVEIEIDILYAADKLERNARGVFEIQESDLFEGINTLFSGRMLNKGEVFPLQLYEEQLVLQCTVLKIENINVDLRNLRYGVITEETTELKCAVNTRKKA
jgi:hypothetical protein